MSVNYSVALKTARLNATRTYFQNGVLKIRDSSNNVLVSFVLNATAGSVDGVVWTMAFSADTVQASGTGVAANAVVENSGGVAGITGLTVGTSGTSVIIDNVNINSGQNISITSATITHAP